MHGLANYELIAILAELIHKHATQSGTVTIELGVKQHYATAFQAVTGLAGSAGYRGFGD